MDPYPGGFQPQSHESYAVFGVEAGPLPLDVNTPTAAPSLALIGFGDVPSSDKPENPSPISGMGMRGPAAFLPGMRAPVITQPITLSNGAAGKKFLQSCFTSTPTSAIPAASRFQCLPLIAYAYGYLGNCDASRARHELARYCLVNTVTIDIAVGQPARATLELWPLFIDENATVTLPAIDETAVFAASGEPFGWQHFFLDITDSAGAGYDYSNHVTSLQIQASNNLSRSGMRRDLTGGDSNPMSRVAGSIDVGDFTCNMTLGLKAPLPTNLSSAAAKSTRWGAIAARLTDGTTNINIAAAKGVLNTRGQRGAGRGPISSSASITTTGLSVT